jgi:hypothetical protein
MVLCSSFPSSFAAAGMSCRLGMDLGLDLDREVGEAGSYAEPSEDLVVRRGVTGCKRRRAGLGVCGWEGNGERQPGVGNFLSTRRRASWVAVVTAVTCSGRGWRRR